MLFFLRVIFKFFIEETPTPNRIGHVHIDDTPRCKNGFFVGVLEVAEDFSNLNDTSGRCFSVCRRSKPSDPFSGRNENIAIIVLCKIGKELFRYTGGHEFLPGIVIDNINETVNVDIFLNRNISTVNHKWHTDRYTAKDIDRSLPSFLSLLLFLTLCDFFRCQRLWFLRRFRVINVLNLFTLIPDFSGINDPRFSISLENTG